MEDVLEVYKRPYDPLLPVVCFDETSKQLIEQRRITAKPGRLERIDYEYRRHGVANIFMMFEPLAAKRITKLTQTRTRIDFAHCIKELVDINYPCADKIILVMDCLVRAAMAEIEIGVLSKQCLGQSFDSEEKMSTHVAAWNARRNCECKTVNWRFTTEDARIKLKKLYPKYCMITNFL